MGEVIGKIEYRDSKTDELIGESEIVASNEIKRSTLKEYILYIFGKCLSV